MLQQVKYNTTDGTRCMGTRRPSPTVSTS